MLLREKLEAIWKSRRVACPSHRTIWSEEPIGWKFTVYCFWAPFHFFYRQGRLVGKKYFVKGPFDKYKKKVDKTLFNKR